MIRNALRVMLGLLIGCITSLASAHEIRPALLQITQKDAHLYEILWKQPVNGEVAVHLEPRLSGGGLSAAPDIVSVSPSFALKIWKGVSDAQLPLDAQTVTVDGLQRTITDVLVNVTLLNGRSTQLVLKPQHNTSRLDLQTPHAVALLAYLSLGIEHILTGVDHLLFVLGLLLLVKGAWALVRTISAFTAAHSVTLAATALGWIHVRPALIEALVALSIVVLAVELVRQAHGERGWRGHRPWLLAFLFGLLHGCAFAGALAEVGLPSGQIPGALLLFNLGVEAGQLLFVALACAVLWLVSRVLSARPSWLRFATPYAIGTCAAYWFVERFLSAIHSGPIS